MAKKDTTELFQVKSEDMKSCQKRYDFTVSKDNLKKEIDKVTGYFINMASIPGFRRGKAPVNIVIRKYEKDIVEELKMRLYSQAFEKLRQDDKLDIVSYGAPVEKNPLTLKAEGDYEFSFAMELAPEIELPDYQGMKADVKKEEISADAIQERIKNYGEMYGAYADIDGKAAKEDMLKVSYTSDFELPEDAAPALQRQLNAKENWVWLSEPEMIPGVIAALEGAEKDKDYEFAAEYPADYRDEALAGKKVNYKVHVIAVQRRSSLTEEQLVEKMNLENIDKLHEMIKGALEREQEGKYKAAISEDIMKQISESVGKFDLPPNLLNAENEKELRRFANETVKNDEDVENFKANVEKHKEEARVKAEERLRRMFICRKIAEKESIAVEQSEIDSHLKMMSRYYGYKEGELKSMLEKNGGMEDIHLDLLMQKVTDYLASKQEKGQ